MKIRVNNEFGDTIAECTMDRDEYGNWYMIRKTNNIENIFADMEQDDEIGFVDTFDIDIKTEKVEE